MVATIYRGGSTIASALQQRNYKDDMIDKLYIKQTEFGQFWRSITTGSLQ